MHQVAVQGFPKYDCNLGPRQVVRYFFKPKIALNFTMR